MWLNNDDLASLPGWKFLTNLDFCAKIWIPAILHWETQFLPNLCWCGNNEKCGLMQYIFGILGNMPCDEQIFQTFQMQVEDIARRLWEAGIPEKLIKYYIPLRFLRDEKMETPLEPFQVFHNYSKAFSHLEYHLRSSISMLCSWSICFLAGFPSVLVSAWPPWPLFPRWWPCFTDPGQGPWAEQELWGQRGKLNIRHSECQRTRDQPLENFMAMSL